MEPAVRFAGLATFTRIQLEVEEYLLVKRNVRPRCMQWVQSGWSDSARIPRCWVKTVRGDTSKVHACQLRLR